MQEILLDASGWTKPEDLYHAFFQAVGAPQWHGRNFNALRDSIAGGRINKIEVPYRIRVKNFSAMGEEVKGFGSDFVSFVKELRDSGCPIDIVVQD
jgi:RNAse (barnase) inhibitor barstar